MNLDLDMMKVYLRLRLLCYKFIFLLSFNYFYTLLDFLFQKLYIILANISSIYNTNLFNSIYYDLISKLFNILSIELKYK